MALYKQVLKLIKRYYEFDLTLLRMHLRKNIFRNQLECFTGPVN